MTSYGPPDPAARIAQAKYDDILTQYHRQRSEIAAGTRARSAQWDELMAEQDARIEKTVADAKAAEEAARSEATGNVKAATSWGAKSAGSEYLSFDPADDEFAPAPPQHGPPPAPDSPPPKPRGRPPRARDDFDDEDFSDTSWLR